MSTDQRLIEKFLTDYPDIALSTIENWESDEIASLIEVLQDNYSLTILSKILPYKAGGAIERMQTDTALKLIGNLPIRTAALLLLHVNVSTRDRVLKELPNEKSQHIHRLLMYSNDVVGGHLEPQVLTVSKDQKVSDVIASVKRDKKRLGSNLYVVDRDIKLVGVVQLKDLLVAEPENIIQSIAKPVSQSVFIGMNADHLLSKWDDSAIELPVVDEANVFIGTISRSALSNVGSNEKKLDQSAIVTGNALGDLYLIGLTSLFGGTPSNQPTNLKK